MKLKVCGMKYADNIEEVAELSPDYLGFIFYEKSSRFFDSIIPALSPDIKKVGVYVNASIEFILKSVKQHSLEVVQLHGQESPEFCKDLREQIHNQKIKQSNHHRLMIIKVFSIKNSFDFSILQAYESVCDFFLFDTKGELPGGNGETFDWTILSNYPSKKPFFLSGGIGLENSEQLQAFLNSPIAERCHAIDVNSKFERSPGLKNVAELKTFITNFQKEKDL